MRNRPSQEVRLLKPPSTSPEPRSLGAEPRTRLASPRRRKQTELNREPWELAAGMALLGFVFQLAAGMALLGVVFQLAGRDCCPWQYMGLRAEVRPPSRGNDKMQI